MRWTEKDLAGFLERNANHGVVSLAPNTADTSAPPFALPADITVDLPFPPSVNKLWRSAAKSGQANCVYLAPSYVRWKQAADALWLGHKVNPIRAEFEASILVCPPEGGQRGDLDNRIKAVLDWLQRVGIVANDKHCQRLMIEWTEPERAPRGCRVTIRPLASVNA